MFGNGIKIGTQQTPQWAWDIVEQVKNDYHIYIYDIHWHNSTNH